MLVVLVGLLVRGFPLLVRRQRGGRAVVRRWPLPQRRKVVVCNSVAVGGWCRGQDTG